MVEKELLTLYNHVKEHLAELVEDLDFANFYRVLQSGKREYSLNNKFVHRVIDDEWVNKIADAIPALDTIVNNPRRYMKREEEVVPIEKARIVDSNSVKHLAAHTNLINNINADGTVMPKQILSPFNDESLELYENRFVKTVIKRLTQFVDRRYMLLGTGGNEFSAEVEINGSFEQEGEVTNYSNSMTVFQGADYFEGGISDKVYEKLFMIRKYVDAFRYSPFMRAMASTGDVRPPIAQTNLLKKEPNYRKCVELWDFMENYNKAGYAIEITDYAPEIGRSLIDDFDSLALLEYIVLKRKIADIDPRRRAAAECDKKVIYPLVKEAKNIPDEEESEGNAGGVRGLDLNGMISAQNQNTRQAYENSIKEILVRALKKEEVQREYEQKIKDTRDDVVSQYLEWVLDRNMRRNETKEQKREEKIQDYVSSFVREKKAEERKKAAHAKKRDEAVGEYLAGLIERNEKDRELQARLRAEEERDNELLIKQVLRDSLKIEEKREYKNYAPTIIKGGERMPVPINSGLPVNMQELDAARREIEEAKRNAVKEAARKRAARATAKREKAEVESVEREVAETASTKREVPIEERISVEELFNDRTQAVELGAEEEREWQDVVSSVSVSEESGGAWRRTVIGDEEILSVIEGVPFHGWMKDARKRRKKK